MKNIQLKKLFIQLYKYRKNIILLLIFLDLKTFYLILFINFVKKKNVFF